MKNKGLIGGKIIRPLEFSGKKKKKPKKSADVFIGSYKKRYNSKFQLQYN